MFKFVEVFVGFEGLLTSNSLDTMIQTLNEFLNLVFFVAFLCQIKELLILLNLRKLILENKEKLFVDWLE